MKNSLENISLPEFNVSLVQSDGDAGFISREVSLKALIAESNKGLVLYFYPKDNTPGCIVQAEDFSANLDELAALGYTVLGVSRDGVKSHQNFITKKNLSIGLISDSDEALCQHFDVIKEKMLYGKTHLGVVRSTFVFNKAGEMVASLRNVKAKEHVSALLELLATL